LNIPSTIANPISFFLNQLPLKKPKSLQLTFLWLVCWPMICIILHEMGLSVSSNTSSSC
ncbi:uncharacterized protein BX663DRAFT_431297, partial [Cokeromyces recurvatus]|uniref:uncharacterized protein n=1 Tax=Cokeromyces recurvatus TaxID=90255 RepID=UPI002220659D